MVILEILGDERYCAIARCTASPRTSSLCATRMPLVLPVSLSLSLCLAFSPCPRRAAVPVVHSRRARDIGLRVSSMRKFTVLYRSSRKPSLQPDIHSLASRLSSISRHWRCCYPLFEAAFSFRSLLFSPFFSRPFFPGSRPLLQVYDSHFRRKNRVISENMSEIPPT